MAVREILMRKYGRLSIPESYFLSFISTASMDLNNSDAWSTVQFAKDFNNERLSVVGTESGEIILMNFDNFSVSFSVPSRNPDCYGCVLDVGFVPQNINNLVSISGHSAINLWDVSLQRVVREYRGHQGSVRALALCDFCPHVFSTASREGKIYLWDNRERNPSSFGASLYNVIDTHFHKSGRSSENLDMSTKKGVTSLVYIDEFILASSTNSFNAGIRLWDIRYFGRKYPLRVLEKPDGEHKRDYGIISLCVDRYSHVLFAASTDSLIYEYIISSSKNKPVDFLRGGKRSHNSVFASRLNISASSNYLIFGNEKHEAHIWDLQKRRCYSQRSHISTKYPCFVFGGHSDEVMMGAISCQDNFVATIASDGLRYWHQPAVPFDDSIEHNNMISGFSKAIAFDETTARMSLNEKILNEQLASLDDIFISDSEGNLSRSFASDSAKFCNDCSDSDAQNKSYGNSNSNTSGKNFSSVSLPLSPLKSFGNLPLTVKALKRKHFHETMKRYCAFNSNSPTGNLPDFVKEIDQLKAIMKNCTTLAKRRRFAEIETLPNFSNNERQKSQDYRLVLESNPPTDMDSKDMDFISRIELGFCHPVTFRYYQDLCRTGDLSEKASQAKTLKDFFCKAA